MYRYKIELEANISPLVPSIKKFENHMSEFMSHMGFAESVKIRGNVLDLLLTSDVLVRDEEKTQIKKIVVDTFNVHMPEYNWSIKSFEEEE